MEIALVPLLTSLFDAHALRSWVLGLTGAEECDLASHLPAVGAALAHQASEVVGLLAQHGLVNGEMFDSLTRTRPRRREEIEHARSLVLGTPAVVDIFFALGEYKRLRRRLLGRGFTPQEHFIARDSFAVGEAMSGWVYAPTPGYGMVLHVTMENRESMLLSAPTRSLVHAFPQHEVVRVLRGFATEPRGAKSFRLFWSPDRTRLNPLLRFVPDRPLAGADEVDSAIATLADDLPRIGGSVLECRYTVE